MSHFIFCIKLVNPCLRASEPEKVEERDDHEQKRPETREWTAICHYQLPSSLDGRFSSICRVGLSLWCVPAYTIVMSCSNRLLRNCRLVLFRNKSFGGGE